MSRFNVSSASFCLLCVVRQSSRGCPSHQQKQKRQTEWVRALEAALLISKSRSVRQSGRTKKKKQKLHPPGIEPGARQDRLLERWQCPILPLNHRCGRCQQQHKYIYKPNTRHTLALPILPSFPLSPSLLTLLPPNIFQQYTTAFQSPSHALSHRPPSSTASPRPCRFLISLSQQLREQHERDDGCGRRR
jgi:hypothetical protein